MVPVAWAQPDGVAVSPAGSAEGGGAGPWAQVCEVVVTLRDVNFLGLMARGFVVDGVVACVHQVEAVRALRLDVGELEDVRAARAHLHTRVTLVDHIVRVVGLACGDKVMSVVVVPLVGGDPRYAAWVVSATAAPELHIPPPGRPATVG